MGLGDMLGKAAGMMGDDFDFAGKMDELGIDPAMLANLDLDAAKAFIEERGFDLSILDTLGIDLDEMIAKFKGDA